MLDFFDGNDGGVGVSIAASHCDRLRLSRVIGKKVLEIFVPCGWLHQGSYGLCFASL